MTAEDSVGRAEDLLVRLEAARAELERLAAGEETDAAIDVLGELAEIAREVERELARAKREAES